MRCPEHDHHMSSLCCVSGATFGRQWSFDALCATESLLVCVVLCCVVLSTMIPLMYPANLTPFLQRCVSVTSAHTTLTLRSPRVTYEPLLRGHLTRGCCPVLSCPVVREAVVYFAVCYACCVVRCVWGHAPECLLVNACVVMSPVPALTVTRHMLQLLRIFTWTICLVSGWWT